MAGADLIDLAFLPSCDRIIYQFRSDIRPFTHHMVRGASMSKNTPNDKTPSKDTNQRASLELTEEDLGQISGGQIESSANGSVPCIDGVDYGNGCGNGTND